MKILKFGGKSLSYGNGFNKTIEIILEKINNNEKIAVVVSAISNATDELEDILNRAVKNEAYLDQLQAFKTYQKADFKIDLSEEFLLLEKTFEGVSDFRIDDFHLQKGIYVLKIVADDRTLLGKMIVN